MTGYLAGVIVTAIVLIVSTSRNNELGRRNMAFIIFALSAAWPVTVLFAVAIAAVDNLRKEK